MTQKDLHDIADKHYRKMQRTVHSIVNDTDPEAIHQLRVEYKKLRAFFRLLSSLPSLPDKIKVSKKLKHLYAVCGEIRDLQLQQERISNEAGKNRSKVKAYVQTLERQIERIKPKLQEVLTKKPVTASRKKTDKDLPDSFSAHDFRRFARQQWTAIKAILRSRSRTDDDLHTIRKHLKDLYYNLKIYEGAEHRLLMKSAWKEMDETFLSDLLDQLGRFQDRSTSLLLLDSYWFNKFGLITHQFLDLVQSAWIKDHRTMQRILIKQIDTKLTVL